MLVPLTIISGCTYDSEGDTTPTRRSDKDYSSRMPVKDNVQRCVVGACSVATATPRVKA